jgi:hypothetical protein
MSVVLLAEAADQRNSQIFVLDDARRGCMDPGLSGSVKASTSPLVTARSSAMLGPSSSMTVHFGRMPPSDVPRPRKYARSAAFLYSPRKHVTR